MEDTLFTENMWDASMRCRKAAVERMWTFIELKLNTLNRTTSYLSVSLLIFLEFSGLNFFIGENLPSDYFKT